MSRDFCPTFKRKFHLEKEGKLNKNSFNVHLVFTVNNKWVIKDDNDVITSQYLYHIIILAKPSVHSFYTDFKNLVRCQIQIKAC